jgi:hypothetical protein
MDIDINKALEMGARVLESRLRFQAPVDTGALKKSVKVNASLTADGFRYEVNYLKYGKFTDLGTGKYYRGEEPKARWKANPGKEGKGGIKPRYWTNLPVSWYTRINRIIEKELAKQMRMALTQGLKTK